MHDPPADLPGEPRILPARKITGAVAGLFVAAAEHFETRAVDALTLDFRGIEGDIHGGITRRSGGREPWYKRGTEMRNERQLSIVAADELAVVAQRMDLPGIQPEWLGANLLLDGVPHLSMVPSGSLLFFKGGVTIKIDAQNAPCRQAGRQVALRSGMADVEAGALMFPKVAKRLRGLVAWVEKPGVIRKGESLIVHVPEQWIYGGQ